MVDPLGEGVSGAGLARLNRTLSMRAVRSTWTISRLADTVTPEIHDEWRLENGP